MIIWTVVMILYHSGKGDDIIKDGTGIDTLSYKNWTYGTGVSVNLALTTAQATGGSGTDTISEIENLTESNYNDILTVNSGVNVIDGGLGSDTLTGGSGEDTFVFSAVLSTSTNKDTIIDFSAIDDTIYLENAIFTKLTATGALNSSFFAANATGTAVDADDYILYNTTTGILSYDADGNGAGTAIEFALLGTNTHPTITNVDFIVI